MSLSDLSSIGSLISGVGVMISLIYLSIQTRQSSRNQQATIHHDRVARIQEFTASIASNRESMDCWIRGNAGDDTLDSNQACRYGMLVFADMLLFQEYFHQRQEGMLNAARYSTSLRLLRSQCPELGFRAAWQTMAPLFEPRFAAAVNQLMQETAMTENADWFAPVFKNFVAAERAKMHAPVS
jgi:hypothetical protein